MILRKTSVATRSAFSLMEMLVVVAIIVALAGIGGFYYFGQLEESKKSTAYTQMRTLENAAKIYQSKNDVFPEKLSILLEPDPNNGNRPYLDDQNAIIDPWNQEYQIETTTSQQGADIVRIFTQTPKGEMLDTTQRRK